MYVVELSVKRPVVFGLVIIPMYTTHVQLSVSC